MIIPEVKMEPVTQDKGTSTTGNPVVKVNGDDADHDVKIEVEEEETASC